MLGFFPRYNLGFFPRYDLGFFPRSELVDLTDDWPSPLWYNRGVEDRGDWLQSLNRLVARDTEAMPGTRAERQQHKQEIGGAMSAKPPRKRVLILADNQDLCRDIQLDLSSALDAVRYTPSLLPEGQSAQAVFGCLDLIVLALSSPKSEPAVMLFKSSLLNLVGEIPLLIISERSFFADPQEQIFHLDFPFDLEELHDQVKNILHVELALSGPASSTATAPELTAS
jgi:hypothetical protein